MIDEVRGPLRHAATGAARTHRPPLAGEGHQPVDATPAAPKPREPAGQPAAPQKLPERVLDKPRHAVPVPEARGLRKEGLEVIVHDPIERAGAGRPRLVDPGRNHTARWRKTRARSACRPRSRTASLFEWAPWRTGNCEGAGSCRAQATAGFAALGAGTGAIVGMAVRARRAGGRVIYRR